MAEQQRTSRQTKRQPERITRSGCDRWRQRFRAKVALFLAANAPESAHNEPTKGNDRNQNKQTRQTNIIEHRDTMG